jgi:hypothetical protein
MVKRPLSLTAREDYRPNLHGVWDTQCAAWIVWNLDHYGDQRVFRLGRYVVWLEEARPGRRLLLWVSAPPKIKTAAHARARWHFDLEITNRIWLLIL